MIIREEKTTDKESLWNINQEAFGGSEEASLVNTLRSRACPRISLVAEIDQQVVGYILFTPVILSGNTTGLKLAGLAPMAVMNQYQRQGIGSRLVNAGLDRCKKEGYDAVVVLGHPTYYPKFGFRPAKQFGIQSEYDVPDEVFMVLELTPGSLKGNTGTIQYHEAFNSL